MERTIEVLLRDGFEDSAGGSISRPVSEAIGYLAMWSLGNTRIKLVKIAGDRDGNLDAIYLGTGGVIVYEIGGVIHRDVKTGQISYSFHS